MPDLRYAPLTSAALARQPFVQLKPLFGIRFVTTLIVSSVQERWCGRPSRQGQFSRVLVGQERPAPYGSLPLPERT